MSSKWITPKKRLAIMFRDGLTCVYCGKVVEDGVSLTLDHVVARNHGGSNLEHNVVCCCNDCNIKKSDRPLVEFLLDLGDFEYTASVQQYIMDQTEKDLTPFLKLSVEMLETRRLVEFTGNHKAARNGALNGKGKK